MRRRIGKRSFSLYSPVFILFYLVLFVSGGAGDGRVRALVVKNVKSMDTNWVARYFIINNYCLARHFHDIKGWFFQQFSVWTEMQWKSNLFLSCLHLSRVPLNSASSINSTNDLEILSINVFYFLSCYINSRMFPKCIQNKFLAVWHNFFFFKAIRDLNGNVINRAYNFSMFDNNIKTYKVSPVETE